MCSHSATSVMSRCSKCGAVARQQAVYCPQCGTPLSNSLQPPTPNPKTRGKFPWFLLLFFGCFFGVFQQHRGHSVNTTVATPAPSNYLGQQVETLPPDALQAIQPSDDVRWNGSDVNLNIYNGSQWTICYLDLEIQIKQGFHSVDQTYRATINSTPLQPLTSEYVTVHTALPRMSHETIVNYRIVRAMGIRPG